MRRRRLVAVALASVLAGCSDADSDGTATDTPDEPPAEVVESRLVRENPGTDEERVFVEGVVERTRDVELTYLEVRVRFYSADDELLDSTVEHLDDVTEGDRWTFTVPYAEIGAPASRVADHDASVVENP